MTLPVVSDAEVCPERSDLGGGYWIAASHVWETRWAIELPHFDIKVCRYCGGRRP